MFCRMTLVSTQARVYHCCQLVINTNNKIASVGHTEMTRWLLSKNTNILHGIQKYQGQ